LGVCIDSAHLWGAGFDIGTSAGAGATLADLDRIIGVGRVFVLHLNDTSVALGSHRDIHARVGEGIIGQEGLATLLRAASLAHAAVILETPIRDESPGKPDWAHEAAHLRRVLALAGRPAAADAQAAAADSTGNGGAAPAPDGGRAARVGAAPAVRPSRRR
jgi:deoxyribonuclease-4